MLCFCPLVCFHPVFGDEFLCDFCVPELGAPVCCRCECTGEDTGIERLCCMGSSDDESVCAESDEELDSDELCVVCGDDARNTCGDPLTCAHCKQVLCPEHFSSEKHSPCRLPPPPSASPLQEVVSAMNLHRLGDESLEESDTLSGQGQDLSGSERG